MFDQAVKFVEDQFGLSNQVATGVLVANILLVLYIIQLGAQYLFFSESDTSKSSGKRTDTGDKGVFSSSSSKKVLSRDYLVIVGASGSGKTALFYKLLTKDHRDTLSSTDVNKTIQG